MRTITEHQVNPANDVIQIVVNDAPGAGGANHRYELTGFDTASNPSKADPKGFAHSYSKLVLLFQNGPIAEAGVNGVTHEVLLAIVADRLRAFQAGPYACRENAMALLCVEEALGHLHARTRARVTHGVEGTSELTPVRCTPAGGWGWWASFDGGERYTVGPERTREAVIEGGRGEVGGAAFHILEGRQDAIQVSTYFDARLLLEAVDEQDLGDPDGDGLTADITKEQTDDLERRVGDAVDRWQDHHGIVLTPWKFTATRNEEVVPAIAPEVVS